MKRATVIAALAALTLSTGSVAAAQDHSHSHDGPAPEMALELNNGAKWQTDEPLRKGMDGIRGGLLARLPLIHENKLPAEAYVELAGEVEGHIEYMVENCELSPEADAQLHMVLGQVLEGSEAMKAGGSPRAGAVRIVKALNAYGEYFEHPGWKKLGK